MTPVVAFPHVFPCACRPDEGVRCQHHARQPRPCRCGGTLELIENQCRVVPVPCGEPVRVHTATVMVPCITTDDGFIVRGRSAVKHLPRGDKFWACNSCEHCEVA